MSKPKLQIKLKVQMFKTFPHRKDAKYAKIKKLKCAVQLWGRC